MSGPHALARLSLATLALSAGLVSASCTPLGDPALAGHFEENFDRDDLGEMWNNTGASWRIVDGELAIDHARNRPLWLRRQIPRDVRIEFDARSMSEEGDIKVEVFGDGQSRALTDSYTATSYVVIFGGWGNSLNVLARLNEHGDDRVEARGLRVEAGHTYHMRIERRGSTITAWADDQELVTMNDDAPLRGAGHDHFAFNNWEAPVFFDNLRITAL